MLFASVLDSLKSRLRCRGGGVLEWFLDIFDQASLVSSETGRPLDLLWLNSFFCSISLAATTEKTTSVGFNFIKPKVQVRTLCLKLRETIVRIVVHTNTGRRPQPFSISLPTNWISFPWVFLLPFMSYPMFVSAEAAFLVLQTSLISLSFNGAMSRYSVALPTFSGITTNLALPPPPCSW